MEEALADFLRHLSREKNASALTSKSYREDLRQAIDFLARQAPPPRDPGAITSRHLRAFLVWLHEQGYAKTTVARRLAAVRSWLRFLCRRGQLAAHPADGLRGPRREKPLPHFLPEAECGRLVSAPEADTPLALRDRAL